MSKSRTVPTVPFTMQAIGKLPTSPTGKVAYRVKAVPGLYVVVSHTGTKSFNYVRRVGTRIIRATLGKYPTVTVASARTEVARLGAEVSAHRDPTAERRRVRGEATFAELFERFMAVHARPHLRTADELESIHGRYLTPLDTRKLSEIAMEDVQRLHNVVAKTNGKYAANRALAMVSTMYAKCAPGMPNPTKGVTRFHEESRERFLDADEIQRLLAALADEPDDWRHFFTMLLLTGVRRGNAEGMKWEHVSLERGLWVIPAELSKNHKSMSVVLVPAAVDMLQERQDRADGSPWVFPARVGDGHVVEPKAAWQRILQRAQITGVRMHDLRRSLGSWMAAQNVSLTIIGKTLGHQSQASTAIYSRLNLDPVRAAVTQATDGMLRLLPAPKKAMA